MSPGSTVTGPSARTGVSAGYRSGARSAARPTQAIRSPSTSTAPRSTGARSGPARTRSAVITCIPVTVGGTTRSRVTARTGRTENGPVTAAEFDRIDVGTLRRAGSVKWSMYPEAIGAFVAEMDFGTAPPVTAALHAAVDAAAFGYLPAGAAEQMSTAYAAWSRDRYGWAVDPVDVRPVADVVAGLTLAIEHFSAPGRRWCCRRRRTCRSSACRRGSAGR